MSHAPATCPGCGRRVRPIGVAATGWRNEVRYLFHRLPAHGPVTARCPVTGVAIDPTGTAHDVRSLP